GRRERTHYHQRHRDKSRGSISVNTMREKQSFTVKDTFGVNAPESLKISGFSQPGNMTPSGEDGYIFPANLSQVLTWFEHGGDDGLYLTGPTGCGKSTLIRAICQRLNLNLIEVP